jgi:xanthine/CO dehydrogenase XdhC/CoxF family maturation factor
MNRRETERLLAAIHGARSAGKRAAIATVVRVRGSAYRREGTRIVVMEDGSYECLLSGGCLEPAVAAAASRVIETGTPVVAEYDLEADTVWSLGMGCSGAVDVLIERLEDDPLSLAWLRALQSAEAAVLVKSLTESDKRLLVGGTGVLGTLGQTGLDAEAITRARARLDAPFPQSGPDSVGATELFFEVSAPPPELIIFGAGFDADVLARQGWELGHSVAVVDAREAFLGADRFPHATRVCAHFTQFADAVQLTERSFVVIMNHHLERDRECLRFALGSRAPYIGVLGPRSRFDKLRTALSADGHALTAADLSRVRSPVGLAIGADAPEEIAVSILGEIIAVQRGFDGGFLDGRDASLHRAPATSALARS